jgi:L-ascorbate metabolism protein UlaG (beta-lactamase superfamily)
MMNGPRLNSFRESSMLRTFMAGLAGLLVACPVVAADKTQVRVTWHAQSYFEIASSKGTTVVIDPHAILEYGKIPGVRGDVILVTHLHSDHTQVKEVENAEKAAGKFPKAKVIMGLKKEGLGETWVKVDEKVKDVRIRSVPSYHDNVNGMKNGKNTIFVLEMDGITVVHLGDLGHKLNARQLKTIGPVDVLLIPVGGVYTINGTEAKEVVDQIKPKKYIIPMHCATRIYDDLLSAKEFLEEFPKEQVAVSSGNTLMVNVDYKPPAPIVAVLNWEATIKKKKKDEKK